MEKATAADIARSEMAFTVEKTNQQSNKEQLDAVNLAFLRLAGLFHELGVYLDDDKTERDGRRRKGTFGGKNKRVIVQ